MIKTKYFIHFVIIISFLNSSFAQNQIYTSGGELLDVNATNCTTQNLGLDNFFTDIAILPNGELYGINDSLYLIDVFGQKVTPINQITLNGLPISGTGLVGLNNSYLIGDYKDSLVKINKNNATAVNLGSIGYYCNGDFAYYQGVLYMLDVNNHLIKIELNKYTDTIVSVVDIGELNLSGASAYSIYTSPLECSEKLSLTVIAEGNIYIVDVLNANTKYICTIPNHFSLGAASLYDFEINKVEFSLPNVFSPNSDGVNDEFKINNLLFYGGNFLISVYNKWGVLVYENNDVNFNWDGTNIYNKPCVEGVYYYVIHYVNDCSVFKSYSSFINLFR